jgi:hypothetical protein
MPAARHRPGQGDQGGRPPDDPAAVDHHWWVACVDPFGRARAVNVLVRRGEVVLVTPPGEAAVLSVHQTRQLGRVLTYVAAGAGRR